MRLERRDGTLLLIRKTRILVYWSDPQKAWRKKFVTKSHTPTRTPHTACGAAVTVVAIHCAMSWLLYITMGVQMIQVISKILSSPMSSVSSSNFLIAHATRKRFSEHMNTHSVVSGMRNGNIAVMTTAISKRMNDHRLSLFINDIFSAFGAGDLSALATVPASALLVVIIYLSC